MHSLAAPRPGISVAALQPLLGAPYPDVKSKSDLKNRTVFDVLEWFHKEVFYEEDKETVRADVGGVVSARKNEICQVARDVYHRLVREEDQPPGFVPDFECNDQHACRSFAIHEISPHGSMLLPESKPVWLPDFSTGVRSFAFFGKSPLAYREERGFLAVESLLDSIGGLLSRIKADENRPSESERTGVLDKLQDLLHHEGCTLATHSRPDYDVQHAIESLIARLAGDEMQQNVSELEEIVPPLESILKNLESSGQDEFDRTIEKLLYQLRWSDGGESGISKLECHLCDKLSDVYDQAEAHWNELKQRRDNEVRSLLEGSPDDTLREIRAHAASAIFDREYGRVSGEDYLVIDAIVDGFHGHRSLRRDNPEVPSVGNHRLLAASALRRGLAKPEISSLFPIDIWRSFARPVQHFLLQAAEQVGALSCRPLYPNVPIHEEMQELIGAADAYFKTDDHAALPAVSAPPAKTRARFGCSQEDRGESRATSPIPGELGLV